MIDRLYEINRVLDAVRTLDGGGGSSQPIPIGSIVRLCRDTVVGGLLPDHEQAINFAAQLGLLKIEGGGATVLPDGLDFLSLNPERYIELTVEQRRLLARKQYLDGCFSAECRRALRCFSRDDEGQRLVWCELDDASLDVAPWLIAHLCQLRVLRRTPSGYETVPSAIHAVLSFLNGPSGLTEESLRQMLIEKQEVGDIGEELAAVYEQDRLRSMGKVVEAHCVRRISSVRVDAGYDIESFSGESTSDMFDRFIEVKAARGKDVRFFWSENEMKIAEKLRDRYWIYFIGSIDQSTRTSSVQPLLFQDPIRSIVCDSSFSKHSQGMLVHRKDR